MRVPVLAALVVLAVLGAAPTAGAAPGTVDERTGPTDDTVRTANRLVDSGASHTANGSVNATVRRARGGLFDDLTGVDTLLEARERGDLVVSYLRVEDRPPRPAFVPGDVLVVRLESERLAAALRARNGSTPTARYLDYVNRTDARLQIVQTMATTPPELQPQRIVANESRIRVLAENDTLWLLLDTGNVTVGHGNGVPTSDTELHGGQAYGVWFDFCVDDEGLPEVGDHQTVTVADPGVAFDVGPGRDRLYLSPVSDAAIPVSATLAPGTEVTVRAHLPDGTVRREVVLRGRNRTAAVAGFDLSGFDDGRTIRLSAVRDRETVADATAVVDTPNATLRLGERDPWDAVIPVTANLSRGGTVVLQSPNGSVVYDRTTVGPRATTTRILYLPAPDLSNRTRFAVVAYRSLDDDPVAGDAVPYREDGSPVRASGVYDPDAGPPSPTPTTTATPTVTRTATPTVTPTATSAATTTPTRRPTTGAVTGTTGGPSRTTGGNGAGFGPVAALVALGLWLLGALRGRPR